MALAISPLTTPHTLTLASTAYTSDFEVTGMARRYAQQNLSDDIIHLAVTEHIKEAGKLLIGWVSEDYHRLDELDDLQKMVIQFCSIRWVCARWRPASRRWSGRSTRKLASTSGLRPIPRTRSQSRCVKETDMSTTTRQRRPQQMRLGSSALATIPLYFEDEQGRLSP